MKTFVKKWGGFVALCLIAIMLLVVYTVIELKCGLSVFRIITGLITLPACTFCGFGAIMSFLDAKGQR